MTHEELHQEIARVQLGLQKTLSELMTSVAGYVTTSEQAVKHMADANVALSETVSKYIAAAEARSKQLESSMDALIRAITAEHGNGKQ